MSSKFFGVVETISDQTIKRNKGSKFIQSSTLESVNKLSIECKKIALIHHVFNDDVDIFINLSMVVYHEYQLVIIPTYIYTFDENNKIIHALLSRGLTEVLDLLHVDSRRNSWPGLTEKNAKSQDASLGFVLREAVVARFRQSKSQHLHMLGSELESIYSSSEIGQNVIHHGNVPSERFSQEQPEGEKSIVAHDDVVDYAYTYLSQKYGPTYVDPSMMTSGPSRHAVAFQKAVAFVINDHNVSASSPYIRISKECYMNWIYFPFVDDLYVSANLPQSTSLLEIKSVPDSWFRRPIHDLTYGFGVDSDWLQSNFIYDVIERESQDIFNVHHSEVQSIMNIRKDLKIQNWRSVKGSGTFYWDPPYGGKLSFRKPFLDLNVEANLTIFFRNGAERVVCKLPFNAVYPQPYERLHVGKVVFLLYLPETFEVDEYYVKTVEPPSDYFEVSKVMNVVRNTYMLDVLRQGDYLEKTFSRKDFIVSFFSISNVINTRINVKNAIQKWTKAGCTIVFNYPMHTRLLYTLRNVVAGVMHEQLGKNDFRDFVMSSSDMRTYYEMGFMMLDMRQYIVDTLVKGHPFENGCYGNDDRFYVWGIMTNEKFPSYGVQVGHLTGTLMIKRLSGIVRKLSSIKRRETYDRRKVFMTSLGYVPLTDWDSAMKSNFSTAYLSKFKGKDFFFTDMVDKEGYFQSISGHVLNMFGASSIFIMDMRKFAAEWSFMFRYAFRSVPKGKRIFLKQTLEPMDVWHLSQEVHNAISYGLAGVPMMPFIDPDVIRMFKYYYPRLTKQ